jgi:hypothetical protein
MINSQNAAGSTIELFGYRYELPREREYEVSSREAGKTKKNP